LILLDAAMFIHTARFILRDFLKSDRAGFISYQTDPRYQRLYSFKSSDTQRATELFDLFIAWQNDDPRRNFQVGIFEQDNQRLCGCAGLRKAGRDEGEAVLGVELAPDYWGRYRMAIEIVNALLEYGFFNLDLHIIVGNTASGNTRVERLAFWFGANIVARRAGSDWMTARARNRVGLDPQGLGESQAKA
jgi:[ribosomal protein S5]-alanine N-acetyltransferase